MALSCGQMPDHSTIAGFISAMEEEIHPLYRDILLVCDELKLLGGTSFALDGLKLPSNASKHESGTQEEFKIKKKKLEEKISRLIKEHQKADKKVDRKSKGGKKESKDGNRIEKLQLERLRRKAEKIDAYIPDVDFRSRDARFEGRKKYKGQEEKAERYDLEYFRYDVQRDCYICPEGKTLSRKSSKGIQKGYRQYAAKERECMICEKRSECIRMPNGKKKYLTIAVKTKEASLSKQMRDKIDTPEGRKKYERRLAIVEPVFANIRARKRMDRFTLRSKAKVDIQWKLYCLVHNIEKIVNYAVL